MGYIDIGMNHIDACKKAGCTFVKFQLWNADKLYRNTPLYKTAKKLELKTDMAEILFEYGRKIGVDVFFSIFDYSYVDFCENLGVKYYKIAARSVHDKELIKSVAITDKTTFISFSKQYPCNIEKTLKLFTDPIPLYTISKYPPEISDFVFKDFNKIISLGGGYSNHYPNIHTCKTIMDYKPSFIEVHVALDKICKNSPDIVCSINFKELEELVKYE